MYHEVSRSQSPAGRLVRESFDRDYVERLKQGDAATERHFTKHFGDLLRLKLRARMCSVDLIEDLRQETFLRVLTALRRKDGLKCPEGWGLLSIRFARICSARSTGPNREPTSVRPINSRFLTMAPAPSGLW